MVRYTPDNLDSIEAQRLRKTMVETQLASRDITDNNVLAALSKIPRHLFGPFKTLQEAYADNASPIHCEQTISQPYMVAYMTQALDLQSHHKVLEVGTGSGYQTAVLCELCENVYTVERHPKLAEQAQALLHQLGYKPKQFHIGDGALGLPEKAPFDRIIVTAAATATPQTLLAQLSPQNGIIVFPVNRGNEQELLKVTRQNDTRYVTKHLGGVRFVPLVTDEI